MSESSAGCREFQMMERAHNNAARARDVALVLCEKEVGARRSSDILAAGWGENDKQDTINALVPMQ